jgi:hypothetical protein
MLKKIMKLALTLQKDTLAQCLRTGQSGYSWTIQKLPRTPDDRGR